MPLCKAPLSFAAGPGLPPSLVSSPLTHIQADSVAVENQRLFRFKGNVQVSRAGRAVSGDAATYDRAGDHVDVKGNVHYSQDGLKMEGDQGSFDLKHHTGSMDNARYQYDPDHIHGRAKRVIIESDDVTRLKDATLTTCDPDDEVWLMRSTSVELDKASGRGHAFNITFHVKGVPVFYFPYLSFPISDKRKTGFLIPSVRTSSRSGFTLNIPYYFNIAPNLDATLTPHIMTRRGIQYENEFRYLTRTGHGVMNLQYIPNDRVYGGDRAALSYLHDGTLLPHLSTEMSLNYVTDKNYLQDFADSLSTASTTYLDNRLDLVYARDSTYVLSRLQAYQTIDKTVPPASRPYQQLPQLIFSYSPVVTGDVFDQSYALGGGFVRYDRQDSVTADRLDLHPSVSLPLRRQAGFFIPRLTLSYTRYALQNQGPGVAADQSRTLPMASVDGGIYLERNVDWGSHHWLQTLEPRTFYLYVPYKDQSQLPVFDTGEPDLNMSQIFSDNRFSGTDRIGDANQITLGLTTRFLQRDSGRELFSAGVGQIVFFRDRRVTLPGKSVQTGNTSNIVAETTANLGDDLSAYGDLIWDRNTHDLDKGTLEMRYRRDASHIVNVGYRFVRQEDVRQTDIALAWPVARRWRLVGRWNYSLRDHRNLETLAGVEYDSCCWGVRAVWRQFVSDVNGDKNTSLMLQVVLNGLTSIGSPVESFLERGILGY